MSSSYQSIFTLGATKIGFSAEVAVLVTPMKGQQQMTLKCLGGGTLEIFAPGFTNMGGAIDSFIPVALSAAGLSAAASTGYIMTLGEVLTINGPATFYLNNRGASSALFLLYQKGCGY